MVVISDEAQSVDHRPGRRRSSPPMGSSASVRAGPTRSRAARALMNNTKLTCGRNCPSRPGNRGRNRRVHQRQHHRGGNEVFGNDAATKSWRSSTSTLSGRTPAKRAVAIACATGGVGRSFRRRPQGGHAEEHHHDRSHGRRQNRDHPAAGQPDRHTFVKVEASRLHGSRLLRPRRREHHPRSGRGGMKPRPQQKAGRGRTPGDCETR